MNPFATLADAPRLLRHPQVRDLAWVIVSPALLDDPALTQRHPLQASDWADQPQNLLDWLYHLDADPSALLDWLAQHPVQRLGLYYERLWQFTVRQAPGVELLAANLPVRLGGRTLGEFDLLLQDADGCHHLELAVKFYLARSAGASADAGHWLGPGSHDRLDLKRAQMSGPQLALSRCTPAQAILAERGWAQPQPALWLAGYLFQPWPLGCSPPAQAAADHLRGHWLRQREWPALLDSAPEQCWRRLPRQAWLAPLGLNPAQLSSDPEDIGPDWRPSRASLLAHLEPTEEGRWEEVERLIVVPDDWPTPDAD